MKTNRTKGNKGSEDRAASTACLFPEPHEALVACSLLIRSRRDRIRITQVTTLPLFSSLSSVHWFVQAQISPAASAP
ncbi:MAG: hypothetical protein ACREIA_02780 [Opitutaceae bacterium]